MIRKISHWPFFLIISGIFAACNPWPSADWIREGEAGEWSVELPAFLVEATTLNSDAVMQRKAVRKNFFVIVRKDSLQALRRAQPDFLLEDFLDLSIERILNQLTEADVPQDTALSISGLPAHVATITGTYRGQMVEYRMSVIEGKDYLYQLLVWVPKDEAVRLSPYMDKVIMSFREN